MEYCQEGDLKDHMRKVKTMSEIEAIDLLE